MQPPKKDGSRHREIASGFAILAHRGAFGFADFLQDFLAGGDVSLSSISEDNAAASAVDQLGAQMRFEFGNFSADGSERHAELTGSSGEAPGFHGNNKDTPNINCYEFGMSLGLML